MLKRLMFLLLSLLVVARPVSARKESNTTYLFRFMPAKDLFYVPWNDNEKELERLLAAIGKNRTAIDRGQMYLCVMSYGADGNAEQSASEVARIRRNRVKSELITRGGVKECHFVTGKAFSESYKAGEGELRNVVVVMLPASAGKVAEIVGTEAAARVEIYNREVLGMDIPAVYAKGEALRQEEEVRQTEQRRVATEKVEAECTAKERTEREFLAEERAAQRSAGPVKVERFPYVFTLRANLLRWATLTPDLGIEWRVTPSWAILVNGSLTSWSWNDKDRRYALWEVSPEARYYIGKEKRGYIGAMFKAGEFNYKLSETGRQGDLTGGGITGGYQLKLNRTLSLDFNWGIGYLNADYERYKVVDGVRVRQGSETKNWWGPVNAGITLVWNIF